MDTLSEDKAERTRRRNSAAGRVSRIRQQKPPGDPERVAAEIELAELAISERVREIVESFPRLGEDQIARIVTLLRSAPPLGGEGP